MSVLAIDPGTTDSAIVELYGSTVLGAMHSNHHLLSILSDRARWAEDSTLVVEMVASYGMPVGAEVFETCVWIGRFIEAWIGPHVLVYRREVKLHLCGQTRAKDGNVRQALLDRWGGKAAAMGNKANPGPLYGFKADLWQALALAVTYSDTHSQTCATTQATASQVVS